MKKILFLLLLITSISQAQTTLANKLKITGNSISTTATKVNVQETDGTVNTKPLSDFMQLSDIAGKENQFNKQNSLATDGTGVKYPTVDAVNSSLASKADFNGTNASGSWGISISGSATNAANWGGRPADFSANVGKIADIVSFDSSLGYYRKSTSNQVSTFLSPYSQQIWGLIGDSFAELNIYQGDLETRLGIYTISDGIGGSCITGGTNFAQGDGIDRVPFVDRIDAMLANTTSGIIIQGGSNDFYYQAPLGDINSTDRNTFYGALKEILLKCVNKVTPNDIRLITPTVRDNTKEGGTLGRAYYYNQLKYVNAMKEVAQMYGVICIDSFSGSGFTYENLDVLTSDGVHPNVNGSLFYNNFLINNFDVTSGNSNAPLNSATLTGTPTAPTAAPGTNTTQIATTAFVQATRPYKVYTALLNQSGTSAPVATVLENTLGTITLNYTSAGSFTATSSALFTLNKTTVFTQELFGLDSKSFQQVTGTSNINLYTSSGGSYISGLYNNTLIEIRVYN